MKNFSRLSAVVFGTLVILGPSFFSPVFADDPPGFPRGSSVEVIEKKIREEAKKKVSEKSPEKTEVQLPQTPKKKGNTATAFVREIRIQSHPSVPQEKFDSLIPPESFKPLTAPYLGREVSFDELTDLTAKIEQELRAKGYLAVARVPPQDVSTGEVLLEVLLSRMGNLTVEGNRFFRKKKIKSYWRVPKGSILRYDKIQSSLISLNENPDRKVQPLLKAGQGPGTTDVILKTEDRLPLHAAYGFDNQGVRVTGKKRNTFSLRSNNLLGLDDIFLVGTTFGSDFGALFLQHVIPLNAYGTRFAWGFTHAQVTPQKEFENLGINGLAETYSLALHQKLITKESFILDAHLGFDFKEKTTVIQNATDTWDRLRVLSAGNDLQWAGKTGLWTARHNASFGFSPHGSGFALTSRQGEPHFFKYDFGIERHQKLPFGTEGLFRFEGQLTPDKLTPSEEYFFGGALTVRGYPESDYGADQGILTSLEHHTPLFFLPEEWKLPYDTRPLRQAIQLTVFLDHGYGVLHKPSDTEFSARNLLGVGGGFLLRFRENFSARLEWGARIGDAPLTEAGDSQVHFRILSNF